MLLALGTIKGPGSNYSRPNRSVNADGCAAGYFGSLGLQMKLLKCAPTKGDDGENNYTNVVEMISDDPSELKSKATDLCRLMGVEPAPWCSRYPIMGDKEVQSNHEWIMELSNGISFAIEK